MHERIVRAVCRVGCERAAWWPLDYRGVVMSEQPQPPKAYPVGAIVNGHVWTGSEWVPAVVVPQPVAAQPVQPRRPPLSQRFDALPVAARIGILAAVLVVGLPIMLYVYSLAERI